ncbi:MAG: tetratricopeptide repeat protein [Pseudomonadota bacterium]
MTRNIWQTGEAPSLRELARDAIPLGLVFMLGLVVLLGLNIAYSPEQLSAVMANGSPQMQAAHSRQKAQAEIRQRFEEGVDMLNREEYQPAIKSFHRVLELAPSMPEAYVNIGYALIGQKQYAVARDFFEGAIELRMDQVNAYYGLAEALEGLNDLAGALGAMRTYLHLAPRDDPYRRRAEAATAEWQPKVDAARSKSDAQTSSAKVASPAKDIDLQK